MILCGGCSDCRGYLSSYGAAAVAIVLIRL